MLKAVHYFLDRFVFAVGLLVGSQIPAFIVQYRQRLAGRLEQLEMDLALFQDVANRYFDGSLTALIDHHLQSDQPAFHAEGKSVQWMLEQQSTLSSVYESLQTNLTGQIAVLVRNMDWNLAKAVLHDYEPALIYSPDALVLTLGVAFGLVLIYQALVYGIKRAFYRFSPQQKSS